MRLLQTCQAGLHSGLGDSLSSLEATEPQLYFQRQIPHPDLLGQCAGPGSPLTVPVLTQDPEA